MYPAEGLLPSTLVARRSSLVARRSSLHDAGPAVVARALTKRYGDGTVALNRLDLTIGRGEFVAFLGRSGAGKTTLFRLLNGTLRPTAGELTVLGESIGRLRGEALRRLRRRVAIVP